MALLALLAGLLFWEPKSRDQAWAPASAVGTSLQLISVSPASSLIPHSDHTPRMEENQGVGYIFGLSTVLLGLCFIMSMGVFSVYHPYKLGERKKSTCFYVN